MYVLKLRTRAYLTKNMIITPNKINNSFLI